MPIWPLWPLWPSHSLIGKVDAVSGGEHDVGARATAPQMWEPSNCNDKLPRQLSIVRHLPVHNPGSPPGQRLQWSVQVISSHRWAQSVVISGHWSSVIGYWSVVVSGQWSSVVISQWSSVSGHHPMVTKQWSPVHGQQAVVTSQWSPVNGHQSVATSPRSPSSGHQSLATKQWSPVNGYQLVVTSPLSVVTKQ